ncbi:response regulator transcription factor [candidate division CSSED10-310 bacterium]|uniref:Response regulator transcription factor n=1 Tax=candidate division CSSED10-310 bacterium TaxID=2855610 RepID=A0ABV6Z133_UNCC1
MAENNEKTKILIADDNQAIRKLLSIFLETEGFQVVEATNGQEALDEFKKEQPHIILLDIMMPKMFGWDVLQKIKQQNPATKVIVMTAVYKKSSYRLTTMHDYGADEFITKPFELPQLLDIINVILSQNGP